MTNNDLLNAFVNKLTDVLLGGDEVVQQPGDDFIAWLAPGIPFGDTDFAFAYERTDDATRQLELYQLAEQWARLTNLIPGSTPVVNEDAQDRLFTDDGRLVWNVYNNVLRLSEVADGGLTATEMANIERFRKMFVVQRPSLFDPTVLESQPSELTKLYDRYESEYIDAVLAYNSARLAALDGSDAAAVRAFALNGPILRSKVDQALKRWIRDGKKNDVDQINAYIQQVTQRSMVLIKDSATSNFEAGKLSNPQGGTYYSTLPVPARFTESKWQKFNFSESQTSSFQTNSSTRGSVDVGAFRFFSRAQSSGSRDSEFNSLKTSGFRMTFEVAQVKISRPWFSPEFVLNTAWRFRADQGQQPLSTGASTKGEAPSGQMPAYPTTAIFVRNVELEIDELRDTNSKLRAELRAKTSIGLGPIRLGGGSASFQTSTQRSDTKVEDNKLTIEGIQLVGFKCKQYQRPVPQPNPDVTTWK